MARNANRSRDSLSSRSRLSQDRLSYRTGTYDSEDVPEFTSAFRSGGNASRRSVEGRPYYASASRSSDVRADGRRSRSSYGVASDEADYRRRAYGALPLQDRGDALRVHAEAYQPMGSHSYARTSSVYRPPKGSSLTDGFGERRSTRGSASAAGRWEDEFDEQATGRSGAERSRRAGQGREHADSRGRGSHRKMDEREKRRRARAKAKAEKKYERQFGGSSAPAADAGPRAAVYKGSMGSKHRQAARMQQGKVFQASPLGTVVGGISGLFSTAAGAFRRWHTLKKTTCVLLIVVATCVFLYSPAQQYYKTLRTNDQLRAEYAALEARNSALGRDVAALQTDEGIKARAHDQLGWVDAGEQTANVHGLDIAYDRSESIRANIPAGSVEAPDTAWYTPVLDAVFGVE